MSQRVRVQRSVEEKWEILEEGLRSGNIAETCRRYGIASILYYRWKDEAQQRAMGALGGALMPRFPVRAFTSIWHDFPRRASRSAVPYRHR